MIYQTAQTAQTSKQANKLCSVSFDPNVIAELPNKTCRRIAVLLQIIPNYCPHTTNAKVGTNN